MVIMPSPNLKENSLCLAYSLSNLILLPGRFILNNKYVDIRFALILDSMFLSGRLRRRSSYGRHYSHVRGRALSLLSVDW